MPTLPVQTYLASHEAAISPAVDSIIATAAALDAEMAADAAAWDEDAPYLPPFATRLPIFAAIGFAMWAVIYFGLHALATVLS